MTELRRERMSTMSKASEVVAIALSQIGYREKASNANLDDPTANAGDANYTKYGRDLAAAGYYNGSKNGYAWCDVFVDWCFFKAYGADAGQRIQCQTGELGAGCSFSAGYYRQQGRYDNTPMPGDQVFFNVDGGINHTGLVVEVTADSIATVEGNSGDMVQKHSYPKTSARIAGYGHPKYDSDDEATAPSAPVETPVPAKTPAKAQAVTVSLSTLKLGSTGTQVMTIQRILYSSGIDPEIEIDGDFGLITKAGVVAMQKRLFPEDKSEWDGVVGAKTWQGALTELE